MMFHSKKYSYIYVSSPLILLVVLIVVYITIFLFFCNFTNKNGENRIKLTKIKKN